MVQSKKKKNLTANMIVQPGFILCFPVRCHQHNSENESDFPFPYIHLFPFIFFYFCGPAGLTDLDWIEIDFFIVFYLLSCFVFLSKHSPCPNLILYNLRCN